MVDVQLAERDLPAFFAIACVVLHVRPALKYSGLSRHVALMGVFQTLLAPLTFKVPSGVRLMT